MGHMFSRPEGQDGKEKQDERFHESVRLRGFTRSSKVENLRNKSKFPARGGIPALFRIFTGMKTISKIACLLAGVLALAACRNRADKPACLVQVALGGWDKSDYPIERIVTRIDSVNEVIPVRKVLVGWSPDKEIYRQLRAFLDAKGIEMYLWLPVFAETEEVCDNAPAVDLSGGYSPAGSDGVRFGCPSDPRNAENVVALYDSLFSDFRFDGVFLDRIRTRSFDGGVGGVLGCGCPVCRERFAAEGVDLEAVKAEWDARGDAFFSVTGYDPTEGFRFENPLAAAFFKAKGHVVSNGVTAIADSLRSRGLGIGMNLFAPFLAPFVGQDYSILASHADFIKPMLYRVADVPGGMGFEYGLLKKAVPGAAGYPEFTMDTAFLDAQLDALAPYPCEKYPGIEVNRNRDFAPTTPEYVAESMSRVMAHDYQGAALSWNIMRAPKEHFLILGEKR